VPLVPPSTALFRLTDAPGGPKNLVTAVPPIAVPDTVTVPPVAELPKTFDRKAEPGVPLAPPPSPKAPLPPIAMAETVACPRAIPLAEAVPIPPLPPEKPPPEPLLPFPPVAVEETDALVTLVTVAFENALPPGPPRGGTPKGGVAPLGPAKPPAPPVAVAVAKPLPAPSAVLVVAIATADPPNPPSPPGAVKLYWHRQGRRLRLSRSQCYWNRYSVPLRRMRLRLAPRQCLLVRKRPLCRACQIQ
jgi:hypothetical protein